MKGDITMDDIALELNLSKSTVSKAMNGYRYVSASTRDRVLKYAAQVGYTIPESSAPAKEEEIKTTRVGFAYVPQDMLNYYNPSGKNIMQGFVDYATKHQMETVLIPAFADFKNFTEFANTLRDKRLDYIFACGLKTNDTAFALFQQAQKHIITWDLWYDSPYVHCIYYDSLMGAMMATNHLISLGHTKIGFIGYESNTQVASMRFRGYVSALAENNIPYEPDYVFSGDFEEKDGFEGTKYLIEKGVSAIFCVSDLIALGAYKQLRQMGLDIPNDISLVGYDDSPLSTLTDPQLTSVYQDSYLIGETIGTVISDLRSKKPVGNVMYIPKLIVRGSTAENNRKL